MRLPGLSTAIPPLIQHDLNNIPEPHVYKHKTVNPQYIVHNNGLKYRYQPIGGDPSTMLYIKPYDMTQSTL